MTSKSPPPFPTLQGGSDASTGQLEGTAGLSAEDELRQIANLQFLAICAVNEFLIPLCEKRRITLSPQLQLALLENMLSQAYRTSVHKKVSLLLE